MSLSTLVVPLLCVLALLLLTAYFVLRIVRDALREIARDEIKAAIPQLSFGLVRRAAADIPEEEASIVEEWERRLGRYKHRPLLMLGVAINIYRERTTLAAEVAEPSVATEGASPGVLGLAARVGHFLAVIGARVGRNGKTSRPSFSVRLAPRWSLALYSVFVIGISVQFALVTGLVLRWVVILGLLLFILVTYLLSRSD